MSEIFIYNKKIESIFQLLGSKENDISYSVGWALAKSHRFLDFFLRSVVKLPQKYPIQNIKIKLQKHEKDHGFTDFEIEYPGFFHLIIEAKRGWNFPEKKQLLKYVNRESFVKSGAKIKKILVLSESSKDFAKTNFKIGKVGDIKVETISWKDIYLLSGKSLIGCSHKEKHLLIELRKYLENIISMQNNESNWVYVVVLNNKPYRGGETSNINLAIKKLRYFHPFGSGGWPTEPPNYIAFRYNGQLQSIHHINGYEVFTNPHSVLKEIPDAKWEPHILYYLDSGFKPEKIIKNGKIYPNGRYWVMLDTLFTSKTIAEARDLSKLRSSLK